MIILAYIGAQSAQNLLIICVATILGTIVGAYYGEISVKHDVARINRRLAGSGTPAVTLERGEQLLRSYYKSAKGVMVSLIPTLSVVSVILAYVKMESMALSYPAFIAMPIAGLMMLVAFPVRDRIHLHCLVALARAK